MRRVFFVLALSGLGVGLACGGSPPPAGSSSTPSAGAPAGKRVDPATAGTITGRVVLAGTPPAPAVLNTGNDRRCAALGKPPRDESVIVDGAGLTNVFVHVTSGLEGYSFDVPAEPVKLDQEGCVYVPHVLGVRVGQPLAVSNSDPTAHNVHAAASVNQQLNTAQPFKGMISTHRFARPEIMVPFKCDIHPWMLAWVGVVSHPYFAVSGKEGRFELNNVPAGTYTVEAWHEKLGKQSVPVTLGEKETRELTLTFKAS